MPLLSTITEPRRLLVDHRGTFSSPLLLGHRLIADDVLAQNMLELLAVTPVLRITILLQKIAAVKSGGTCSI
jgi:hypothetical protein